MGTMRLVVDSPDQGTREETSIDRLETLLQSSVGNRTPLWLDISDPGDEEVKLLERVFGFHELALEEVTRPHERPHCDAYAGYYFIVIYAAEYVEGKFAPRELNLFWGENYLVTIHRRPAAVVAALQVAERGWMRHEGRHEYGIACLAYALFESIVHGYFVVQDRVRERIDRIEQGILEGAEGAAADLFKLRKDLLQVPRLLAPTGHVLEEVLRRDRGIPPALRPYFADVEDHATHVLAEIDTYRDLLSAALDVQVFYSFNRLGITMKRLTAITVIIMVPNFVASIFGMNFSRIPGSDWPLGFFIVAAALMVMVAWGFIHSRLLKWL